MFRWNGNIICFKEKGLILSKYRCQSSSHLIPIAQLLSLRGNPFSRTKNSESHHFCDPNQQNLPSIYPLSIYHLDLPDILLNVARQLVELLLLHELPGQVKLLVPGQQGLHPRVLGLQQRNRCCLSDYLPAYYVIVVTYQYLLKRQRFYQIRYSR